MVLLYSHIVVANDCFLAGDAIIRELDQSRITLRLIEQVDHDGKGNDDHVIAKLTGPTLPTLQRCLVRFSDSLFQ
jgi:hypothetical protein